MNCNFCGTSAGHHSAECVDTHGGKTTIATLRAQNAELVAALIGCGCHDLLCAKYAQVCEVCPVHTKAKG